MPASEPCPLGLQPSSLFPHPSSLFTIAACQGSRSCLREAASLRNSSSVAFSPQGGAGHNFCRGQQLAIDPGDRLHRLVDFRLGIRGAEAETEGTADESVRQGHRIERGGRSAEPLAQAEPTEQVTPAMSKAIISIWPSMPGKAMLLVCGSRAAARPWITSSGIARVRPSSKRRCSDSSRWMFSCCSCSASSRAVNMPTAKTTDSVPGRKPCC